jgi:hypothetical protein
MNLEQLKVRLEELKIDPNVYSLSGGLPNECLVLGREPNGKWTVYYSERGERSGLREFDSEEDAIRHFLGMLLHDSAVVKKRE